jgi:dipeptidyl aminopeptidase/acylaminoacyl peptidase
MDIGIFGILAVLLFTTIGTAAGQVEPGNTRAELLTQFSEQSSLYPTWHIAVSPDNSHLAYIVSVPTGDRARTKRELRVVNISNKQIQRVCCEDAEVANPSWSPDGTRLAFIRVPLGEPRNDGRLSVFDLITHKMLGGVASLDHANASPYTSSGGYPRWLDHDHLLTVRADDHEDTSTTAKAQSITTFDSFPDRAEGEQISAPLRQDLKRNPLRSILLLDVRSGHIDEIVRGVRLSWPQVSPNGRYLAFAEYQESAAKEFVSRYRVHIVDLHDRADTILPNKIVLWVANESVFSWRPDSSAVAFPTLDQMSTQGTTSYHIAQGRDFSEDVVLQSQPGRVHGRSVLWSGDLKYLAASFGNRLVSWRVSDGHVLHIAHLTEEIINQVVGTVDTDGHMVVVAKRNIDRGTAVITYDIETGEMVTKATVNQEPMYQWGEAVLLHDGHGLLVASWTLNHFVEINAVDWHGGVQQLTDGDNRSRHWYVEYKKESWRTANGNTIEGVLLLPASHSDTAGRLPLVVRIYPDTNLASPNSFGLYGDMDAHNPDLTLVNAGYALFFPNCPTRPESYVSDLANDVFPGIQHLIDIGIASPDKIALLGHSAGVEAALNLLADSTQFKAAILMDGFGNFATTYGDISGYGTQSGIAGRQLAPWQAPLTYVNYSPIFRLDKVNAPVLLLHGTADSAVPVYAGEEIFTDLRSLKKVAQLVEYRGGEHAMSDWTLDQQVDAMQRTLGWLDRYLVGIQTAHP